ncbi:MAG: hypothetical protein B6226_03050 [Candidatus Cloacimonetes bacterium 4572_65]|nr:MAG: hypothetical protein B6226_03050 [Candidatus Cloacimonetes bacterium 4572_65]
MTKEVIKLFNKGVEMKRALIILSIVMLVVLGCTKIEEKVDSTKKAVVKHFSDIAVNNDLTFSGIDEIASLELTEIPHYTFTYNFGMLTKIESTHKLANSYLELSKFFFTVNKEWSRIDIEYSTNQISYLFNNRSALIKFDVTYNEENRPSRIKVLPLFINYDTFSLLGRSKVFTGELTLNDKQLIEEVNWLNSSASYKFSYNSKGYLVKKVVLDEGIVRYRYSYDLDESGMVKKINSGVNE